MDNIKLKQLGAILLLAGLILAGFTLYGEHKKGHLFESPAVVQGRVVDRFTSGSRTNEPELLLRVEVPVQGGTRTIERAVDEGYWNAHDKGARVDVAMHGCELKEATLVGAGNEGLMVWLKIGGGVVAALLGLVVLAYDRWRT